MKPSTNDHSSHHHPLQDPEPSDEIDHAKVNQGDLSVTHPSDPPAANEQTNHSAMDRSGMDHANMQHDPEDHSGRTYFYDAHHLSHGPNGGDASRTCSNGPPGNGT